MKEGGESEEEEDDKMILAALVMNTQGKPRITKFYQNEVRIAPLSLSLSLFPHCRNSTMQALDRYELPAACIDRR